MRAAHTTGESGMEAASRRRRWVAVVVALTLVVLGGKRYWSGSPPEESARLARVLVGVKSIQKPPVVNHAGTRVGLIHTTERGVGVFIAGPEGSQLLGEVRDRDYVLTASTWVFGWSPDDQRFAYSWSDDGKSLSLRIASGGGEAALGGVPLTNGIRQFAWLTRDAGVYVDRGHTLSRVRREADGGWTMAGNWALPATNGLPGYLRATGPETVAWVTENTLWRLALAEGQARPLFASAPHRIDSLSYSAEAKAYLLVLSTNRARASEVVVLREGDGGLERENLGTHPPLREARWTNRGEGYACLAREGEGNVILARERLGGPERRLYERGGAEHLIAAEHLPGVFALAALTNEPPAVWRSEGAGRERLFDPGGPELAGLGLQPVLLAWAPYDRHRARFELIPPANFSRRKKYPLVIGMTGYDWAQVPHAAYIQSLAGSGAYVAMTGYRFRREGDPPATALAHTNNVLAVYRHMAASPNVDTDRVFLFAYSMSTLAVSALLRDHPGLFRGVMLFNPGQLPDARAGMTRRVLVTAADGDHWLPPRIARYERELARVGIPLRSFLHADCGHIERAHHVMRDRARLMAEMVFAD